MTKSIGVYCKVGVILLCFGSCTQSIVYKHTVSLPQAGWHVDFLPTFQFTIKDETEAYDILLLVKSTSAYPYQNLYLTYYLEEAKGVIAQSLQQCDLFDPKTGHSLGRGLGQAKQHQASLLSNYRFPKSGTYTLKLEHFMRTENLCGLRAIGIQVVKTTSTTP